MDNLPRPVRPGDPITADAFNAIAERLEAMLNLEVAAGSGLRMDKGPSGIALGLYVPRGLMVSLSGTTSPYSWDEVEPVAGGTWATFGGRTGTTDAYELNARGGLGGKVVHLTRTSAGDWRFQWVGRTGARFTGGTVLGCSGIGYPFADVVAKDHASGTTLATFTCDSGGHWSGTVPLTSSPQTVDLVFTPTGTYASRFVATTSTFSLPSGTFSGGTTTLAPATGYHCHSMGFYYPLPTNLTLTDSFNGTVTLGYAIFPGETSATWGIDTSFAYPGCPAHGCPAIPAVNFNYRLSQGGVLGAAYPGTQVGTDCPGAFPRGQSAYSATQSISINPFVATGSLPVGNGSFWYCGSAVTFTTTE